MDFSLGATSMEGHYREEFMTACMQVPRTWEALSQQLWFEVDHTSSCAHRGPGIDVRERHGNEDSDKRSDLSQLVTELELGPRHLPPQGLHCRTHVSLLAPLLPTAGLPRKTITDGFLMGSRCRDLRPRGGAEDKANSRLCLGYKENRKEQKQIKTPAVHSKRGEKE